MRLDKRVLTMHVVPPMGAGTFYKAQENHLQVYVVFGIVE